MLRRRWRRSWATLLGSMASRSIAMDGTIFRIDLYSTLFSVVQMETFFLVQLIPLATIKTNSTLQVRSVHSLEKVGVHNVVQVCTDNAPVMTAASRHIFQSISHLYVQGCAAHCLDPLLEDWSKEEWMKKLVKKARIISVFIESHHAT